MSALERLGIAHRAYECKKSRQSVNQIQTEKAFEFKWKRRDTYESPAFEEANRQWLTERYCKGEINRLQEWFAGGRKIILDAGCGAGFSALLLFGELLKEHDYLGVDISDAVEVACTRFNERGINADFLKSDINGLCIPDGSIDIIFSEGVLHHTDNTELALKGLAEKLKSGGRFLFYVYKKKAVIREFTDDYIRAQLKELSDEEAWEALKPLTKLGRVLGDLDTEITIPSDIPFLQIKKGKYNLQRFFYWNIFKAFYRPDYSFEEMNHLNFDWFRPANCHRHTPEEIKQWTEEAGLLIEHMDVQEAGITVVARKVWLSVQRHL